MIMPPVASRIATVRRHHGDTYIDYLEWLRDSSNPEVLAHLEAENSYTEAVTDGQTSLRATILGEIKARATETDLSVPGRRGAWWYYSRSLAGKQYPVYCRVPAIPSSDWSPPPIPASGIAEFEQVILDCDIEAEGVAFFALGSLQVSTGGRFLAYCEDVTGDEQFTLHIKDLETGELLPDEVKGVSKHLAWSPDDARIYYSIHDATCRPYAVKVHLLGTLSVSDSIIYLEEDRQLRLGLALSADGAELVISSTNSEYGATVTLDLTDASATPRMLVPKELHLQHAVQPVTLRGQRMYFIRHNHHSPNNMLSLASQGALGLGADPASWRTVVGHRDDVKLGGAALTSTHIVLAVRMHTARQLLILKLDDLDTPPEPILAEGVFSIRLVEAEFEAPTIRLVISSFLNPTRVYDYVLASGELLLRKESKAGEDYVASDYSESREWATGDDGTRVPLSIIRRQDISPDGSNPCLVFGYGAYGTSLDPVFFSPWISLLDRGIVIAVAHVRGGGELGRRWYEDGKKLRKRNSFTDFVAATRYVVSSGWAARSRIAAMGGSAGGLLVAAAINLAPELYRICVAQVPFVDPLTTILHPELPLTAHEWEEWGNPINDPEVYAYMKSYSPCENIRAVEYPRIAAVTSLYDNRVMYVEPTKWVQRLREVTTGSEPILLKTELHAGHGGRSGRYEVWKDHAWYCALIADAVGAERRGTERPESAAPSCEDH